MRKNVSAKRLLRWIGIWGFVVAQPLFSLFSGQLDFLHSHHVSTFSLLLLAGGLSLLPPVAGWLVESAFYPWRAVQQWIHRGVLSAALPTLVLMTFHDRIPSELLLGILVVVFFVAFRFTLKESIRNFLTLSGFLALAFPILFALSTIPRLQVDDDDFNWQPAQVRSDYSLLLIILDELPITSLLRSDGTLDAVRFPGFAALAAESVYYPNATTVSRATNYAVPALLTGQFPLVEGPPVRRNHPVNLMTSLGRDRQLKVTGTLRHLCPPGRCGTESSSVEWDALITDILVLYPHMILPGSLRRHLPDISSSWRDFVGRLRKVDNRDHPRVITEEFVKSFQSEKSPFFWGIHFLLPHVPWRYLPEGLEYDPLGRIVGLGYHPAEGVWGRHQDLVDLGFRRHLFQLGFADELLGQLVRSLQNTDYWDSTLVIVTADHGGAFEPGEFRRQEEDRQYAEVLNIPLFVKYPGSEGPSVDERFVQTVDIAATVAEVLDYEPILPLEGVSLLDQRERPAPRVWSSNRKNRGEASPIDPKRIGTARQSVLERNERSMGNGPWARVWDTGLPAGWAGRPLNEIPSRKDEVLNYELDMPTLLDSVDLNRPFRPSLIRSRVKAQKGGGELLPIAVVVNGRIAVRASCWPRKWGRVCEAVIPPDFFVSGKNRVRLFAYEETEKGPRLISSSSSVRRLFTWSGEGEKAMIVAQDGLERKLIPGGNRGVARLYESHKRWWIKGWTARRSDGEIPREVAIFSDRRFIRDCPVDQKPPFGPAMQDPRWSKAGYLCEIPWSVVDEGGKESIHIMALYEADAVMLRRDNWVPWGKP